MNAAIPAVAVRGVSKTFELPQERVQTLKERALHPLRRTRTDTLHALRDVSVDVQRGEFFGIVGRNGSGKSTLLKCLAGIYKADRGNIYLDGRLSAFIELGVGFSMDLPARDNVIINATMLGLSPREARRRVDTVVDFAELGQFVDLKLKNYSSGMLVRLAFAVMIQVDADILLIDEVLAVGDAAFQQKCFDEFVRIREAGKTILLVTHDMGAVHRFCDRAMLLERGGLVAEGDPDDVGTRYLELNFSEAARNDAAKEQLGSTERIGDGTAEITDAWFEDEAGERTGTVPSGGRTTFVARVRFHRDTDDPLFGIVLQNDRKETVLAASNLWSNPASGRFAAGREAEYRVTFTNLLTPGRYQATPAVARQGGGIAWIDRRERMLSLLVSGLARTDAVVDLPYDVVIAPGTREGVPS
ncbi:ABC transporter ATP-binding protein [Solirubrobacter ginsenosidimutans]|uniref:ABC transporter ATP-binding protein n=1 Tax=Solirubrobacter ginsenosidimutans TaxID=490573 RepID=A0A9X3N0C0_9ACTN|nr:ABC transporter ATP-binding protein [Solirubrobacter ginsenosidimutans]MDA0164733.1 ABC transporter ATP-binding protein [Solirubrobacter ginsenosidimutans]